MNLINSKLQLFQDHTLGRCLLASENFQKGEILLEEDPIFQAPNPRNVMSRICLSCNFPIFFTSDKCEKCSWPLHNSCDNSDSLHTRNECKIFSKLGITEAAIGDLKYQKILLLRGCLTRLRSPTLWDRIVDLESHALERLSSDNPMGRNLSREMCNFVLIQCQLPLSYEEVDHVLGAILTNAYTFSKDADGSSFSGLFYLASFPAHSCVPNCIWEINGRNILIRALRDIKIGEILTHSYIPLQQGTRERQKMLQSSKFFWCTCARCLDPTELGTHMSTLKCQFGDCDGYVLCSFPAEMISEWKCNKCGKTLFERQVQYMVQTARDSISQIVQDGNSDRIISLKKRLDKKFHPSHYVVKEFNESLNAI